MIFPIVNDDKCPPDDCDSKVGKNRSRLELRPGFCLLCLQTSQQFYTFLSSPLGQVQIAVGAAYSSSDESVLSIDPDTGLATVVGAGAVTVTTTWQGMTAEAQAIVLSVANADCCQNQQVRIVVLGDESLSMQGDWADRRRSHYIGAILGLALAGPGATPSFLSSRTKAATILFSEAALLWQPFSEDGTVPIYPASPISSDVLNPGRTNLNEAIDLALETFKEDPGDVSVLILFSDGVNRPELTTDEKELLIAKCQDFKDGGGVFIVFGLGAGAEGFDILAQLATPGFFASITQDAQPAPAIPTSAADQLRKMLCLLCAGDRTLLSHVGSVYVYGCPYFTTAPEFPDPNDYGDVEEGVPAPAKTALPQLPPVQFSPASGNSSSAAYNVTLSVPGYDAAIIRFTKGQGSQPADPGFLLPSDAATGLDYEGLNVPINVSFVGTTYIKAVARLTGYADSIIQLGTFIRTP